MVCPHHHRRSTELHVSGRHQSLRGLTHQKLRKYLVQAPGLPLYMMYKRGKRPGEVPAMLSQKCSEQLKTVQCLNVRTQNFHVKTVTSRANKNKTQHCLSERRRYVTIIEIQKKRYVLFCPSGQFIKLIALWTRFCRTNCILSAICAFSVSLGLCQAGQPQSAGQSSKNSQASSLDWTGEAPNTPDLLTWRLAFIYICLCLYPVQGMGGETAGSVLFDCELCRWPDKLPAIFF